MSKPCLIWPGAKDKDGYGYVKIAGKQRRAHRVALEKRLGRQLVTGEIARHLCHSPSCVEPSHLALGTIAQNNAEARARRATLARTVLGVDGGGYGGEE